MNNNMTCGEFLKLLQDNPDKELYFERVFHSDTNDVYFSYGYESHQKLGHFNLKSLDENSLTIEIR